MQCRHSARITEGLVDGRSSYGQGLSRRADRAVGSTVSVPRQGRAALAPGPMGTQTTLELKSGGRDRTAQLASDTSPTRSGAFAPAVDVRPRPLDMPSVTHESTAGGQGGSFYVQCRQPARIAGGSRVKGSRPRGQSDNCDSQASSMVFDRRQPAQRIATASTVWKTEGLEDFEGSSCNAAAGVSSGGDTGQPPAPRGPGRPGQTCSHVCAMKLVKKKKKSLVWRPSQLLYHARELSRV